MPATVLLRDVVEALDASDPESEAYLDPETGRIIVVTEEDRMAVEEDDPSLAPIDDPEYLSRIREALESDRFLTLPDSFEIHEWALMERFSLGIEDPEVRADMVEALHGRGAFRAFRNGLDRHGLRESWFAHRDSALEEIARDWLESHGIPYK